MASTFINDADLHGLVDGFVDPERRADVLRRLAGSPADRGRVDAWQGHNDLLRTAFSSVSSEPLPVLLDLSARPQLHCVPANDGPLTAPDAAISGTKSKLSFGTAFATILVVAAGLGGSWIVLDSESNNEPVAGAALRGSVDSTVANRSLEALSTLASTAVPATDLPTRDIPDLDAAGFRFAGAETSGAEPTSIQFRYGNASADRVIVSVARSEDGPSTTRVPIRIGEAYSWRKNGLTYAIAGTLRPQRLQAIAIALGRTGVRRSQSVSDAPASR